MQYLHVLKPFIPYSENIKNIAGNIDIVINYTLDNYIKIYGNVVGEYIRKEGHLINEDDLTLEWNVDDRLKISNIKYKGKKIEPEDLSETVVWEETDGTINKGLHSYVYDNNNNKIYNNISLGKIFLVDKDNKIKYLSDEVTELIGIYYKKVAIPKKNGSDLSIEYYYQALNR